LSEAAITNLIKENAIFTNNIIEVEMSSGPEYEKIHISVTEFQPRNEEFLALNFVATQHEKDGEYQRFIPSYAPPFGLHGAGAKGLKNKCQDHIRSIIEKERHSGEAKRGDTSLISWNIFEAVNNYRKSGGCNNVSNQFSIYPRLFSYTDLGQEASPREGSNALCHVLLHEPNHHLH